MLMDININQRTPLKAIIHLIAIRHIATMAPRIALLTVRLILTGLHHTVTPILRLALVLLVWIPPPVLTAGRFLIMAFHLYLDLRRV